MTKSAHQHIPASDNQKERPILFSTPMVQAILDGRKLMTRRIVKNVSETVERPQWGYTAFTPEGHISLRGNFHWEDTQENKYSSYGEKFYRRPYGKSGDLLWVRERFTKIHYNCGGKKFFKYTFPDQVINPDNKEAWKWKPSIHMPKKAARIWLEVTDVRVERLQDISEEDAVKEGIDLAHHHPGPYITYKDYIEYPHDLFEWFSSPIDSFESLWQSINGPDSWQLNPWVWVVSFKVISTSGRAGIKRKEAVAV